MDWPWMKDVNEAIADPIDLVSPDDERPSVKALIEEYREKIDKIAAGLQDDPLFLPETKHDDLWILRFWLSHKKTRRAIEAAKTTLAFRKEHKLDLKDIRHVPPQKVTEPGHPWTVFRKYCKPGGFKSFVCHSRGVVAYIDAGCIDGKLAVKELDESFQVDYFAFVAEWSFQWLDFMTRTTGRLTKSIRFIDFTSFSLSGLSLEYARQSAAAQNVMEDCYPQMLDTLFVSNLPGWLQTPWNILRPVLPKRMVAKVDFVRPAKNVSHRERVCKHIAQDELSVLFGGGNTAPLNEL